MLKIQYITLEKSAPFLSYWMCGEKMSGREGLLLNGEQDQVPLSKIVRLSQIRGDRNKVTAALKGSILQEGLLYPPIVASVSPALLE